jgi:hypothetical protein
MPPRRAKLSLRFIGRALAAVVGCYCFSSTLSAQGPASDQPAAASADGVEFFEKRIRPLLVANCLRCHGDQREGGLQLHSRSSMLTGGDSGPAVAPSDPAASLLIRAVSYRDEPKMPPEGQLAEAAVADLTAWVAMGAPWPADASLSRPAGALARATHWAFQPISRPAPPLVANESWTRNAIDRFVLETLEREHLTPSPAADRRTLLRRASHDVLGLPPAADEVDAFVNDRSSEAFDQVIERLLDSPHHGERMARRWLDVARYADTKGYVFTEDRGYPNAYKYRDWVIRAFNEDLPYNEFLVRQIAADRLEGERHSLAAMGFLTVGRRFLNNSHDIIDDRIDVLARGTMGLTVTCARCHDHKYDPIPTADYYSLYGVLASSVEPTEPADIMSLADAPQPHEPHVFVRGNPGNEGPGVPRQFLSIIAGEGRRPFVLGSGRLEMALAIVDDDNPLTARVIANRMWMYYFDAPLVQTPSDFGIRTAPPTHPELLDYLAGYLIDHQWSLKALSRLILNSATYQQSSVGRAECQGVDGENRLLWRMNRKRLDFEGLRDSLLVASGQLDEAVGGPSVEITKAPWPRRRTLYAMIDRQNLPNLFRTFDFASPDTHSPQRYATTVPQQAIFLMNSPFLRDQARALAASSDLGPAAETRQRIDRLYRKVLARAATDDEQRLGAQFLSDEAQHDAPPMPAPQTAAGERLSAWERYVQALLLSNEFMYVD